MLKPKIEIRETKIGRSRWTAVPATRAGGVERGGGWNRDRLRRADEKPALLRKAHLAEDGEVTRVGAERI